MLKGFTHARLACGCRLAFREGVEGSPVAVVVEEKGARVIVDPSAVLYLLGTEMDWKVDKLASQFVFNNPNQTSACGCGESVELRPADKSKLEAAGP